MANQINTKDITLGTFNITLASLANASARQSDTINNSTNDYPAALVYTTICSGAAAPTAGNIYEVYLIRGNAAPASQTHMTDNAGTGDAAITIENAPMLGAVVVTATANKKFYGEFDTAALGPLGPQWGIAIKNNSGGTINPTAGSTLCTYVQYVPEIQ